MILAGVLIGLGLYGVDLGNVFLGTAWGSSLPYGHTTVVLEGVIVFITLLFGSLFVGGLMALLVTGERKVNKTE